MNRTKGNLYLCLDEDSIRVLRDRCPKIYRLSAEPHITLLLGTFQDQWEHLIKKEFSATVLSNAWNEQIQAARVKLPQNLEQICQNRSPHITLSWVENVQPFETNAMLWDDRRCENFFKGGSTGFSINTYIQWQTKE